MDGWSFTSTHSLSVKEGFGRGFRLQSVKQMNSTEKLIFWLK